MLATSQRRTHIGIIGGGFTGLVCALRLLKAGYAVTVLEAGDTVGGLTATADFGSFHWDRFYHCILTSDQALRAVLNDIGLSAQLRWTITEVGFYSHGKLHTMTSPADLLRFPHLNLWDKLRFAAGTLYAARYCDGIGLDDIPLGTWTKRIFGEKVYREMWKPLLSCKLGETRKEASAAFLWATLLRLYSTREKGASKREKLGYIHGGYATVFDRLVSVVQGMGAQIVTKTSVDNIQEQFDDGQELHRILEVSYKNAKAHYDGVILTIPNRRVATCLSRLSHDYIERLNAVQYLGLLCVVLVLKRQLSPYYVTNITEQGLFTGIIEMTNLIDKDEETAGYHLVYLPRYTTPDDFLFQADDDDVWQLFEPQLKRIHPELDADDIVHRFIFRERVVQPVPTLGYSKIVPPTRTPLKGVYLANTAQIQNNTLNNNVMAELAEITCRAIMDDIPPTIDMLPKNVRKPPLSTSVYENVETGV